MGSLGERLQKALPKGVGVDRPETYRRPWPGRRGFGAGVTGVPSM